MNHYYIDDNAPAEWPRVVLGIIAFALVFDALGFMAWLASGQHPADGFYIGTITAHVLRYLIGL